jgi:hypothetical protein
MEVLPWFSSLRDKLISNRRKLRKPAGRVKSNGDELNHFTYFDGRYCHESERYAVDFSQPHRSNYNGR